MRREARRVALPGWSAILPAVPLGAGASLWERVRTARRRLLFLDYDGTLAPLRVHRNEATPFPGTLERLRLLVDSGTTDVTIVSGRPLAELRSLLRALPVHLVAEHGWEELSPNGLRILHVADSECEARLAEAAARVVRLGHGDRLERKRTSVVVHVRGLEERSAARILEVCAAEWASLVEGVDLRLDHPSGGLELRATARDKGTFVEEALTRAGKDAYAVYVGDDVTDEDAFRALGARRRGLGIRVGAPGVRTSARARLTGPGAIPEFLERWLAATVREPGHGRTG